MSEAAAAAEVSVRFARKWIGRYRAEASSGSLTGPPRPGRSRTGTSEHRVQAIAALRRLRFTGPEIAEVLGMAAATVSGILTRIGMGKLGRVALVPAQRYERARPGELIHIDIKKLGRIERGAGARIVGMANRGSRPTRVDAAGVARQIAGWEPVHIVIDDCTRLAYAEVLHNHKAPTVVAFLRRAVKFFARHAVTVERGAKRSPRRRARFRRRGGSARSVGWRTTTSTRSQSPRRSRLAAPGLTTAAGRQHTRGSALMGPGGAKRACGRGSIRPRK